MTTGDKNNFEKAFNMLSQIIANIDNINNKEVLKDKFRNTAIRNTSFVILCELVCRQSLLATADSHTSLWHGWCG